MARPSHRLPRHIPAHRVRSKLPSAKAVGTGAVAAGCLAMTLVPGAASAKGHGGGHSGPGGGPPPITGGGTATCTVPTTAWGSPIMISGSGYAPNELLAEWVNNAAMTALYFSGADATGQLSGPLGYANKTGNYTVTVKDEVTGSVQATCSFVVP